MKDSIRQKLSELTERYDELARLLSQPEVITDQTRFRQYSQEYAELEGVVSCFARYEGVERDIRDARQLLDDSDPEMRDMGRDEIKQGEERLEHLTDELQILLLPKDPNDGRNVFLEVRAGTGGDEAALFAGDLHRMYGRYAERMGWRLEVLSASEGEHGGFKEIISRISGDQVYSHLKFESGAHRVQRVEIDKGDLRVDTYRASGAGGQHVNRTDSAVRLTHLPTGIVVECQDERSQHKNKARAMSLLAAKIMDAQSSAAAREQADTRRSLVGSGDRSERIRTYNFPQGRITDHRINLTLYKLDEVVQGALDQVVDPLVQEHQAQLLADMSQS